MTDPVLPGSGRLTTSLSSSSTASFTGPRCGQGGGPRGWLAEDRGLARRREPPTGPSIDRDYEQIRVNMQTVFDDLALTTPAPLAA